MKTPRSVTLGLATALAVGSLAVATAGSAHASTDSFHLYAQINSTALQPTPTDLGTNTVAMTVTPSTGSPGTPIEVSITSPDLTVLNGPAASVNANQEELDAVVNLGGTDYTLRGPQNNQNVAANDGLTGDGAGMNNSLFNAGWVVSSTAGNSSGASTNTAPTGTTSDDVAVTNGTVTGTTGLGTTKRGAETTVVPLVAPDGAGGAYPVTLKAIVLNTITGTGVSPKITDKFDEVINLASTGTSAALTNNTASSYPAFSSPVQFQLTNPSASISSVTDGASTVPAGSPQAIRAGDALTFSAPAGTGWTPSTQVNATICTTSGYSSCAPAYAESTLWAGSSPAYGSGNPETAADGSIPATTLVAANFGGFTGSAYFTLYQGSSAVSSTVHTQIPITLVTDDRTASTPAAVAVGHSLAVTGSNWYPGETVTLQDNGTDAAVQTTASSTGTISAPYVVNDATATQVTATGIGGDAIANSFVTKNLTGTFAVHPTSVYATQSVTVTPSAVSSDVDTVSINWGDGSTTASASKTAATKHTYTSAGSHAVVVTLSNTAASLSVQKSLGNVTVTKDTTKPVVTLTVPSKSNVGSSWKTIKGKVTDKGLGAKTVYVQLIEKKSGKYYAWNGKKWVKESSKAKALKAAKKLTATPSSSGAWSVKGVSATKKTTLTVTYYATDKAGNTSSAKSYSKSITK